MSESTEPTDAGESSAPGASPRDAERASSDAPDEPRQVASEPEPRPSSESEATPARPATGGPALLLSALVLSIVALGLSGWLLLHSRPWEAPGPDAQLAELQARIAELDAGLETSRRELAALAPVQRVERLEQRLEALSGQQDRSDPALTALVQRVERAEAGAALEFEAVRERLAEVERLAGQRLARLEQQLAAPDRNGDTEMRREFERRALLRIDDLLGAARDRLELLGDFAAARAVWAAAIARLEALDLPGTANLEQLLRGELEALSAVGGFDRGEISGRLLRAASEASDWPVAPGDAGQGEAMTAQESGWRARLAQTLDRLVRVERIEEDYLDPVELDAARRGVAFLLDTIALAVVRGDDALASRLAGEAVLRIGAVFDTDSADVADVLRQLDRLTSATSMPAAPSTRASQAELARLIEALQ